MFWCIWKELPILQSRLFYRELPFVRCCRGITAVHPDDMCNSVVASLLYNTRFAMTGHILHECVGVSASSLTFCRLVVSVATRPWHLKDIHARRYSQYTCTYTCTRVYRVLVLLHMSALCRGVFCFNLLKLIN